jgi:hypothetical protein
VFDPNDAGEMARLNAWQDGLKVDAKASKPFAPGSWDKASLDSIRTGLEASCRRFPNFEQAMLPRGKPDPDQRLCAAASGWGLLPASQATYFSYAGGHPITACRRATYQVPKNGAFWSIQVYDKTGFIASENSTLNSRRAKLNQDGTFTAYFGSKELCGDVPNRLDVSDGWNFMMRVYLPDPETVLGGRYTLPATEVVPKALGGTGSWACWPTPRQPQQQVSRSALRADFSRRHSSPMRRAAMKASCGISTLPYCRIRFLPSFCFSSSFRFRVMSPP